MTTIVGAGFATGQEIKQFFTSYNLYSYASILLCAILFSLFGAKALHKAYVTKSTNLDDLLNPMIGSRITNIVKGIAYFFQFIFFIIMQSGMYSMLRETGLRPVIAYSIVFFLMIIIITQGIDRIIKINSVIVPLIVLGIIITGLILVLQPSKEILDNMNIITNDPRFEVMGQIDVLKIFGIPTHSWVLSALLYVGFNALLALPPLAEIGSNLKYSKLAILGGVFGGFVIGAMAMTTNTVLRKYLFLVLDSEMPMVSLSYLLGKIPGILYSAVIFLAMLTSAAVSGYCTVNRVNNVLPLKNIFTATLVCLTSIPLSTINFSTLISFFYPAFGIAGIFLLLVVLIM